MNVERLYLAYIRVTNCSRTWTVCLLSGPRTQDTHPGEVVGEASGTTLFIAILCRTIRLNTCSGCFSEELEGEERKGEEEMA